MNPSGRRGDSGAGKPCEHRYVRVLVSMLHTTAQFNAFQIVVETSKFVMNEPIYFI